MTSKQNLSKNYFENLVKINSSNVTIHNVSEFSELNQKGLNEYFINNNIHASSDDISFINVNIKGSEEDILPDLFDFNQKTHIPIVIKINYELWKNKEINNERFPFLTSEVIEDIKNNKNYLLYFH